MADKKKASTRNTKVKAFEDEDEEDEDLTDLTDDEVEVDDDDDEDEVDEDEEDEDFEVGFAPFIVGEDQDWTLAEVIAGADVGENIYFYLPPDEESRQPAKWYVLKPVTIGELPVS